MVVLELWVGDAAEIKAKRVRKQKNDREDARFDSRLYKTAEAGLAI